MQFKTVGFTLCAVLVWSAVAYKGLAVRRNPWNPRLWAVLITIAFPAVAITIATDSVYSAIARAGGHPHLPTLLMYCCCVGYSISALIMSLLLEMPVRQALQRIARYVIFFALSVTAMVVLFFNVDADRSDPLGMERAYAHTTAGRMFLLIYVISFAAGLAAEAWQGLRFARQVAATGGRPWLRRGLRCTAVGALLAIGYCAIKALFVIGAWIGSEVLLLDTIGTVCAMLGALTMALGLTMPAWGPHCSAAMDRIRQGIIYLQLYSLWAELVAQYSGIALDTPRSRLADLTNLHDLEYRLNRRVVEINDGLLTAQSQVPKPDQPVELAARLKLPVEVLQTAIWIREAARGRDHAPSRVSTTPERTPASENIDDIGWLVQLATALRKLPTSTTSPAADPIPVKG